MATADCHWGPCGTCGVPAATGFACDTGEQGPRILLTTIGDEGRGWQYVGPPGDVRRLGGIVEDASGANVETAAGESRGWPYDLLGSDMQSKDAGLKGLASLVEAAGGESTA
jgi:hypothetical protein